MDPGGTPPRQTAVEWLLRDRTRNVRLAELTDGLATRLLEAGIPVWRVSVATLPPHPEIFTENAFWVRGEGTTFEAISHAAPADSPPNFTPLSQLATLTAPYRLRLAVPIAEIPWLVLKKLAERGATDYFLLPLDLPLGGRTYLSCCTDAPGGFSDADLESIQAVKCPLELRLAEIAQEASLTGLLRVYLGDNAAERVLTGHFRRGTGQRIQAAIWYCDLRGFTSLVDNRDVTEVIPLLDRYFERVAEPVTTGGGEILKFIGDAVLGIFPVGEDGPALPCRRALEAARKAVEAMEGLSREEGLPLKIGVALHLGEVMYGNIGARARLDFTVIGKAVNEVARVEPLCKQTGEPILLTARFREAVPTEARAALRSLGRFTLRGVAEPTELFSGQ